MNVPEDLNDFRNDVLQPFISRLRSLSPPRELRRCHAYSIGAATRIRTGLEATGPSNDPAAEHDGSTDHGHSVGLTDLEAVHAGLDLQAAFDAIAVGRRVCGVPDLPAAAEPPDERDSLESSWLAEQWMTPLHLLPDSLSLQEAWRGTSDSERIVEGSLLGDEMVLRAGLEMLRDGEARWARAYPMFLQASQRLADGLARLRASPEFRQCQAHAASGARRLLAAVQTLAPAVVRQSESGPVPQQPGEPPIGELERWNEALRSIADGRRVCGIEPRRHGE